MPNKIRCAVIGVGVMGKNHLRTYLDLDQVEVIGIADPNPAVEAIAKQYGVKYFSNYQRLIEVEKPSIVSICVPTVFHYEVASFCINKEANILLEKPITNNLITAKKILLEAQMSHVKLLIGHIERHNPAVKKVKEIIDSGRLGEISSIISRRVGGYPPRIKDVDITIDLAIHDVDIVNYFLSKLPKSTSSHKKKNLNFERADSVELFLKYDKASVFIQANWITPVKIRKINITGTLGYLEMDYIHQTIESYYTDPKLFQKPVRDFSDYLSRFNQPIYQKIAVEKKEPLKEELLFFINCVVNDIPINNQFAVDALKIVLNK